jgi:hypothetical protein
MPWEWDYGNFNSLLDPVHSRDKRLNPWNDLFEDRRPEMYER